MLVIYIVFNGKNDLLKIGADAKRQQGYKRIRLTCLPTYRLSVLNY